MKTDELRRQLLIALREETEALPAIRLEPLPHTLWSRIAGVAVQVQFIKQMLA